MKLAIDFQQTQPKAAFPKSIDYKWQSPNHLRLLLSTWPTGPTPNNKALKWFLQSGGNHCSANMSFWDRISLAFLLHLSKSGITGVCHVLFPYFWWCWGVSSGPRESRQALNYWVTALVFFKHSLFVFWTMVSLFFVCLLVSSPDSCFVVIVVCFFSFKSE